MTDFALSCHGIYDHVVLGYNEVAPLSMFDRDLSVPVFWSWLFLGVRERIDEIPDSELHKEPFE